MRTNKSTFGKYAIGPVPKQQPPTLYKTPEGALWYLAVMLKDQNHLSCKLWGEAAADKITSKKK